MTSRSSFKIWICILGVGLFLGCTGWYFIRDRAVRGALIISEKYGIKQVDLIELNHTLEFGWVFDVFLESDKVKIQYIWLLDPWQRAVYAVESNNNNNSDIYNFKPETIEFLGK